MTHYNVGPSPQLAAVAADFLAASLPRPPARWAGLLGGCRAGEGG